MEGTSNSTASGDGGEVPRVPPWERRLVGRLVRRVFLWDRRAGPWALPADLPGRLVRFRGNSGADVAGRWFTEPSRAAAGTVVLVHPDRRYGQHWFVREGHVRWLLDEGFDVLTFDLPGYGASEGGSTFFHEDVAAAVATARRLRPAAPVHVWGVSMGAFAALNAAPRLHGVDGLVLESPYPTFNAWYGPGRERRAMRFFDTVLPRSSRHIQGHLNAPHARPRRILVAAASEDTVTPSALSAAVAGALPSARTAYLEVDGVGHLELFPGSDAYRSAVLATFGVDGVPPPAPNLSRKVGALAP